MYKKSIETVITKERDAINVMLKSLDYNELDKVIRVIKKTKGKVVFMGVGKSGHIGEKLAATFSSTGTASFYVHCTESCHGDLGMIEQRDTVILISNSGSTKEVTQNIEPLRKIGATLIAFTSKKDSVLAKSCDYQIIYPSLSEADHLNLAPTVSSTLTLVLGDAIGCAISKDKDFTRSDFYKYHPNGALGESLKKEVK